MEETLLNVTNSGSNGEEHWEYVEVRPWTRFWARILDYIVFVSLIFFISKTLLKLELNEGYSFLLYLTAVFIWVFVEAVFLSAFGATPGKWLFNITLRDNNGKKLRLIPALSRSMSVWFYGMGTGIPLLCFIGMGTQYNK
ncbi:MAG: RDD family protein, partial [Clostridiaceae bacterium]